MPSRTYAKKPASKTSPDVEKPKTKKPKRKTKTEKKNAFKHFTEALDMPVKEEWFYVITPDFLVFSPFGRDAPVETIGIDIGTKHLGICGLARSEGREHVVCTWFALISVPSNSNPESIDMINQILYHDKNFEFFRSAERYRIEQQVQLNAGARIIAGALQTFCTLYQWHRGGETKDVEYVHGELKYQIAPRYSEEAREDPLRKQLISGTSNTQKRKILGFNDVICLLILNKEKNTLRFLHAFGKFVDQLYDMTDAYLVARRYYEKDLKIKRKKKTVDITSDLISNDNNQVKKRKKDEESEVSEEEEPYDDDIFED